MFKFDAQDRIDLYEGRFLRKRLDNRDNGTTISIFADTTHIIELAILDRKGTPTRHNLFAHDGYGITTFGRRDYNEIDRLEKLINKALGG